MAYVTKQNGNRSNSNSGFIMTIILAALIFCFFLFFKECTSSSSSDGISVNHIKDWNTLEQWVKEEAGRHCNELQELKSYRNTEKKDRAKYYLDLKVLDNVSSGIRSVVRQRDLPDDYVHRGLELYRRELDNCGYKDGYNY